MIEFENKFTPEAIRRQIDDVNRNLRQYDMGIKWPANIKYSSIGGDAAIIQLFLHWAKLSKSRRVFTRLNNSDNKNIRDFARTPVGLAISMASNKFFAKNESTDITRKIENSRDYVLSHTNNRYRLDSELKGAVFAFFCADHASYFSDHLYVNGKPRSVDNYKELAEKLIKYYAAARLNPKIYTSHVENIGTILCELIENTHDHARENIEIVPHIRLDVSVRGLITRKVNFRKVNFEIEADGAAPLKNYFLNLKANTKNRTALYFSVFDMGPGYASKFLDKPLDEVSFDDEYKATVKCFLKNATTKSGIGYGAGLALTLESLQRLGGILILRTGRVSLYINPEKYEQNNIKSIEKCISWHGGGLINEEPPVSGTAITFIVPT